MKQLTIALAIFTTLTLSSCAKEFDAGTGIPDGGNVGINDNDVVKGWVRIKLQQDVQPLRVGAMTRGESMMSGNMELDKIAQELGAVEVRRVFADGGKFAERRRNSGLHLWYDVRFDEALPVSRATSRFGDVEEVSCAEPIYKIVMFDNEPGLPAEVVYTPASGSIVRSTEMPFNDPYLSNQWHYNNDGTIVNSVQGADANIFEAWEKVTGNRDVIVAITDGGIDYNHEDIAANMWINEGEIPGNGLDDDGNGYKDDIYGWNGVTSTGVINPASHGTHVAGTVSAVNHNGKGGGGVAGGNGTPGSGVRLMSCQAFDPSSKDDFTYVDCFVYAADNGAVISQNSWGFTSSVGVLPQCISEAMDYFIDNAGTDGNGVQTGPMKGGIMVFATGNSGVKRNALPSSDPRVIAVTAMSPDYKPGTYTNYGPDADIFAPGGADDKVSPYVRENMVYSTDLNNTYSFMHGTSMACPHVSGVAALIVSQYGGNGFTVQQLKDRLLRAVRPIDSKFVADKYYKMLGVGMLDAGMIFIENSNSKPAEPTNPEVSAKKNELTLSWLVPIDGNELPVSAFDVSYSSKSVGKFEGVYPPADDKVSYVNVIPEGQQASFTFSGMYNTKYDFKVLSVDRFGNQSGSTLDFSFTTGDYENQKPKIVTRFKAVEIEEAGEANKIIFNLADYFTDANLPDGDVLTYTINNRNQSVVKATIENGNQFVLVPLSKGDANISVLVTDIDGEQVLSSLVVTVLNGQIAPPPVVNEDGLSLYPSPAEATLNVLAKGWGNVSASVVVYDSASRRLMDDNITFDANGAGVISVSKLAPGVYTLIVKNEGKSLKASFVKK